MFPSHYILRQNPPGHRRSDFADVQIQAPNWKVTEVAPEGSQNYVSDAKP